MNEKIYLPDWSIHNNWNYFYNNNDIVAFTNENCYYNYNTQYCDCFRFQTNNHYNHSDRYSCSLNNTYNINYNRLTSDFYYRNDIADICIVIFIILLIGFGLPIKLFSRFFRRLT